MKVILRVWPGFQEAVDLPDTATMALDLRVRIDRRPGEAPHSLLATFRQTVDDVGGVPVFQLVGVTPIDAAYATS